MKKIGVALASGLVVVACSQKSVPSSGDSAYQGHGAGSVSPELIAKFAPGAVDQAFIARVQKMLDLRSAASGPLSPDGKTLFYTTSVTGTPQVWRMQGPLGFPRQMTAGSDLTTVSMILPNGKDIVVSRDRGGEENPGLYLQAVGGGPLRDVFHRKGVQAAAEHVTADSKFLYFRANSEKPESYAIHRYDIKSGVDEIVFNEPGTWSIADVRDDREFILSKATGSLWAEYYLWDFPTKKLTPIVGQGEKENYFVQFGADKGSYLVSTPKFGDFRRLYSLRDGKFTPITGDVKKDLADFAIDQARQRIYLGWNDRGYHALEVLDAKTLKPLPFPKVPGAEHVDLARVSRDGRYAEVVIEAATAPRTTYVKDWHTGSFVKWMDPQTPEVDTNHFVPAKLETYTARDGVKIPMFIRVPTKCATTPCPIVVNFHGGPESQAEPGFSPSAQVFVDAGFVFVEPNVRGSDGYGKKWLASDDGPNRLKVVTDIEDASIELKRRFAVDGKVPKIGIMGGSYGGYSTLYGMTRFAGAYDAGAAIVGMSNLITFLNNTAPYRRHLRTSEYGDPEKDRDALVELSPITHINKVKGPLLIIQGVNDPRVPAGEAIQIYNVLQSKGLPSELILFADEGHGAAKRDNRAIQLAQCLRFFEKYLK